MQLVAKVLDRGSIGVQHHGGVVVRQLTFGLCVYPNELQIFPHFLKQIVEVPPVMSRDGHAVRYFVDNVEFFYADLVYGRKTFKVRDK